MVTNSLFEKRGLERCRLFSTAIPIQALSPSTTAFVAYPFSRGCPRPCAAVRSDRRPPAHGVRRRADLQVTRVWMSLWAARLGLVLIGTAAVGVGSRGMPYAEELDGSVEDSLERLMQVFCSCTSQAHRRGCGSHLQILAAPRAFVRTLLRCPDAHPGLVRRWSADAMASDMPDP